MKAPAQSFETPDLFSMTLHSCFDLIAVFTSLLYMPYPCAIDKKSNMMKPLMPVFVHTLLLDVLKSNKRTGFETLMENTKYQDQLTDENKTEIG